MMLRSFPVLRLCVYLCHEPTASVLEINMHPKRSDKGQRLPAPLQNIGAFEQLSLVIAYDLVNLPKSTCVNLCLAMMCTPRQTVQNTSFAHRSQAQSVVDFETPYKRRNRSCTGVFGSAAWNVLCTKMGMFANLRVFLDPAVQACGLMPSRPH